MSYSFLVWNVEKYTAERLQRTQKVADLIAGFDPDVFAILEFKAKAAVRSLVMDFYTNYDFGMTDSKMGIEILVGWRRGKFDQAIYTQRRKFQVGNINLRPGGLLSVRQEGETRYENFLFLHTDSGKTKKDYDNRQKMFSKVWRLKTALQGLPIQNGEPRLLVMGDLNTMGRSRTATQPTIRADDEITQLASDAQINGMRMLSKSHDKTYRSAGSSLSGNLDHVLISNELSVQSWHFVDDPTNAFEVECDGWVNLTGNARTTFIENIADHAALYGEVL